MNEYFPYKHWILTLSVAPLLFLTFSLLKGQVADSLFYYILFCFLSYKKAKALIAKTILVLFSILTIAITFKCMGVNEYEAVGLYAAASIISGFFSNIQKRELLTTDNPEAV